MAKPLGPGARLGRYEILTHLADGGMARVWVAQQIGHLGFRRVVALKTMLPETLRDRAGRAMFVDEALLAARVHHPNVVETHDLGTEGGVVYQAMELVEGVALHDWVFPTADRPEPRALPVAVGVRVALDLLRGLHAAHEVCGEDGEPLGLVHRDVSPANVLVRRDGVAKLSDFGIAKARDRVTDDTRAGAVKGKQAYISPEQLDGLPATRRSDVFAAGVVLWELLTGEYLFGLDGHASMGLARVAAPDPRAVRREIPAPVAAVVLRALREDPRRRFASAREMGEALERAAEIAGGVATHQDVARCLERDLGRVLMERSDALRRRREQVETPRRPRPAPPRDDDDAPTRVRLLTPPEPDDPETLPLRTPAPPPPTLRSGARLPMLNVPALPPPPRAARFHESLFGRVALRAGVVACGCLAVLSIATAAGH